jgi:hypothetical protein
MPTFVTFYGYAFDGAPALTSPADGGHRGWFTAPDVPHLVATRARTALGRATGERVSIYRCNGVLEGDHVWCEDAEQLYDGDATESLWWFTLYCARSVLGKWDAPQLVREYLRTGSASLREVAHKCAWATSLELEDVPRLAARVAMYSASADRPVLAARESCRLAGQIAGDKLRAVATTQERALASALLSAAPRASADAIPTNGGSHRPSRRDTTNLADSLREPPPLQPPATAQVPRPSVPDSLLGPARALAVA